MTDTHPVEAVLSNAGERGPAKVRFHRAGAELWMPDGRRIDFPYAHAQLALGGARDGQAIVTLAAADGEVARLYFPDRQVFAAPPEAWPEPMRAEARSRAKARGLAWLILPGVAAAAVALWLSGGYIVAGMAALVPPSAEIAVGHVAAESTLQGKVETDPVLADTVARIGAAIVAQAPEHPYAFRFRVAKMPIENAFAFPGGEVVVTTGLLAKSTSADEIAGVLGHEVEHVLRRHTTKRLMQEVGMVAAFGVLFGDMGTITGVAAAAGKDLVGLAFGRDQELESDRLGLRLSHAAGFDPRGLSAFFRRMQAQDAAGEDGSALLSTHPAHDDRLAQIDAIATELGPVPAAKRPKLPDWAEVRAHAGEEARSGKPAEPAPRPSTSPGV